MLPWYSGLKQHPFVFHTFCGSEVDHSVAQLVLCFESNKAKIQLLAGLFSADSRVEENLLPVHSCCQNSVPRGCRIEVLLLVGRACSQLLRLPTFPGSWLPSKSATVGWVPLKPGIWFFSSFIYPRHLFCILLLRVHMLTLGPPDNLG